MIIKNLQELPSGKIKALREYQGEWVELIMSADTEYEIHESSDWPDIKPCDQAEKDEYEQGEITSQAKAYLVSTDWYVLRYLDSGEVIPEDVKTLREEARAKVV